jgi:large subunit ribosomal protein L25
VATKELKLAAELRQRTGTTNAHQLRREGKIPGVVYGHGSTPSHISVNVKALDDLLLHGGRSSLVTLTLDGTSETAMIREVTRNPVTRQILHVDWQRVSEREAVHAKLPLIATGTAMGVRQFGGVMDVLLHEIDVEGPVNELPEHLSIDVSDLGIHQHHTAGDVKLPKGFKLLTPPDTIVVSVEASKTAQHLEEAAAPGALEEAPVESVTPAQGTQA